jgi:hypothetical protein
LRDFFLEQRAANRQAREASASVEMPPPEAAP